MSPKSSENNQQAPALTVSQLSSKIKKSLQNTFPENFWLIGEVSEFRVHSSGHAYLELIEKDPKSDTIKAKIKATIWSYTFRMLRPFFEASTGYTLEAGIKIMVSASLEYHKLYGLSLNITDIDPNYTLGDLARKKAEIIERLSREGIIDMNKSTVFPLVPQRIAIISSESAAGYGDFLDSLNNNPYDFHFTLTLYPSVMQGDKAVRSIINSLENIYQNESNYDLVVIVRGGGASTDMECFNDYELAVNISQFPLPVITGIGHERDDTIADLVAYQKIKTPTAVAEHLVDKVLNFQSHLDSIHTGISRIARNEVLFHHQLLSSHTSSINRFANAILADQKNNLNSFSHILRNKTDRLIGHLSSNLSYQKMQLKNSMSAFSANKKLSLEQYKKQVKSLSGNKLEKEKQKIGQYEKIKDLLDPVHILNRGFSITYFEGKALKSIVKLKIGDIIDTRIGKDSVKSEIIKKDK